MDTPKQYFIACAVIFNDTNEILLTKRHHPDNDEVHGKWQFPGGSVELGEHPKDAALREVKEETGLSVGFLSERPLVFSHTFQDKTHVIIIVYKCKYLSGTLDISLDLAETSDAKWFKPDEVAALNSMPETLEIVQAMLSLND